MSVGVGWQRALAYLARRRAVGILLLIAIVVATVTAINPAFLEAGNLRDLLVNAAPIAIVSCGVMLVIITAEIDISVGSLMGFLAACLGTFTSPSHLGFGLAPAIVLMIGIGALVGFCNGVLVTVARVPSIIVTLGMLTALSGATEMVMGGEWITDLPSSLRFFGTGEFLGVPVSVGAACVVIAITGLILYVMPLGRRIYAVGSNREAARLAGLSERNLKLFVFTFTGLVAGVAVLVSAPQLSVIDSGFGVGNELLVVTCVVVGGVSISGGVGSLGGVMAATLLLTMISTVLIFMRLGDYATYGARAIQGSFILAAVLIDHFAGVIAEKRRSPIA